MLVTKQVMSEKRRKNPPRTTMNLFDGKQYIPKKEEKHGEVHSDVQDVQAEGESIRTDN